MSYLYAGNYDTANRFYHTAFDNYIRRQTEDELSAGYAVSGYMLPEETHSAYAKAIDKKNPFRRLATVKAAYGNGYTIRAKQSDDIIQWVAEGGEIPIYEGADDFTVKTVNKHKLACFNKLSEEFAHDASFDIAEYLVERFSDDFARAEEKAFVVGTGIGEPTGLLHATDGAEVGVTAAGESTVTFDEVISLFFSLKPDYRKKAVWIMNDETALALRILKDENGNYLWNHSSDTILGRPVVISQYMPSMEAGKKAIAFGDLRYYWIIDRQPIHIRALTERFALNGMIGYLASEFLDAKLIRPEAVKVLQMKAAVV